ncbi:galactokinase, partial [Bacillus cereus]|nr:galactokinase [Bacillus cereus]
GGFGGSAIALVDSERSEPVRAQIIDAYAAHSFTEPVFLEVEPGPAAGRIC